MGKVRDRKLKDIEHKDIEDWALSFLHEIFIGRRKFSFTSTSDLKNFLIRSLQYKLMTWLIKERYGISESIQRNMRQVARVRAALQGKDKSGPSPCISDVLEKLPPNWNRSMVVEAYTYEEQIRGFINIDDEWVYFDDQKESSSGNIGFVSE